MDKLSLEGSTPANSDIQGTQKITLPGNRVRHLRPAIYSAREHGRAFEHFVLQECWAYSHYSKKEFPLFYWRTASGTEVDLILGEGEVALEIKASGHAGDRTKGLHLFLEENRCKRSFVVSRDPLPRKLTGRTTLLPWHRFCEMLWAGEII